jgi:hypothetical protein
MVAANGNEMFRQRPYRRVFFGLTARNDVRIASNRRAIDAYVGIIAALLRGAFNFSSIRAMRGANPTLRCGF